MSKGGKPLEDLKQIKATLNTYQDREKAAFLPKFFNAFPGGYGEGDQFLGIKVPDQRKVARQFYKKVPLTTIERLLHEPFHEYRLTALFMLVYRFEKTEREEERREIVNLYLDNLDYVNNWDLVDSSAYKILGAYLMDKNKEILYRLARTDNLWKQRIAIIATLHFIKNNKFNDTLEIAKLLLHHEHDLIHKAVGWMLREIGNRDLQTELNFLKDYYQRMPRTMLRNAIEKLEPELRNKFLKGLI